MDRAGSSIDRQAVAVTKQWRALLARRPCYALEIGQLLLASGLEPGARAVLRLPERPDPPTGTVAGAASGSPVAAMGAA
jgi:hypothetical protein